jgi:hypothetical protein
LHAAKLIQRWYRKIVNAKLQQRIMKAQVIILRAFKKYYKVWKQERLTRSAVTIHSFFKEVYDVSKLLKIVKKYRLSGISDANYSFKSSTICEIVFESSRMPNWRNFAPLGQDGKFMVDAKSKGGQG